MVSGVHTIRLPFTRSLEAWADRFADLPGFVYLDNGVTSYQAESEWISALPTMSLDLKGYSGDLAAWIAALEAALNASRQGVGGPRHRIAVGCLDYDAPARALSGTSLSEAKAWAGVYDWYLHSNLASSTTEVCFGQNCSADIRQRVVARLEGDWVPEETPRFQITEPFSADVTRDQYRQAIDTIQEYILAGDCYQVNYAQRFSARFSGDTWLAYRALRNALSGGFSAFLRPARSRSILSMSPERFLSVQGELVCTQPIKGTAPRHSDPDQDLANAQALLASEKDRAENIMITDLLRNDLGKFCIPGSIEVTQLCALQSYRNVHHLVSTVTGVLRKGMSAARVLAQSSPGGSISGAPKKRAVEIIQELEPSPRGAYCGSVFLLKPEGDLLSNIAIRTLESEDDQLTCWGGGGITIGSHWETEYQETLDKVGPLMRTLEALSQ